jgi:hypothetical protein
VPEVKATDDKERLAVHQIERSQQFGQAVCRIEGSEDGAYARGRELEGGVV